MIDLIESLLGNVEGLIQTGVAVAAAAYVAGVWWRTKALVPTLASVALAAVVVWAANNVGFLQEQVQETTEGLAAAVPLGVRALGRVPAPRPLGPVAPPRGPLRPRPIRPLRRGLRGGR